MVLLAYAECRVKRNSCLQRSSAGRNTSEVHDNFISASLTRHIRAMYGLAQFQSGLTQAIDNALAKIDRLDVVANQSATALRKIRFCAQ